MPGMLGLYVRLPGGELHSVEVGADATVGDVQAALPCVAALSFAGHDLDPQELLADAGVGQQAVLVALQPGGPLVRFAECGKAGRISMEGKQFVHSPQDDDPDYSLGILNVHNGTSCFAEDGEHRWAVHAVGKARRDFGVAVRLPDGSFAELGLDSARGTVGCWLWHVSGSRRQDGHLELWGQQENGEWQPDRTEIAECSWPYSEEHGVQFVFKLTYSAGAECGVLEAAVFTADGSAELCKLPPLERVPRRVVPFWCWDDEGSTATVIDTPPHF
eukprot:TRINITY_DN22091_c0_g1_i1.p1 TRINITY_DN22091_c0_g1~~TRINITY_DN22091_c0_g1_i1.p1  ORF type:complete len:299 (+),score=72.45 TRINITY_DN22091_c0_g1_i1:78-899(+)